MAAIIHLKVVVPGDDDSVLVPKALPIFRGNEHDESLACGSCRQLIGQYVSTRTLYTRYATPKRLLIQCICGAHNVVPAHIVER